MEFPRRLGGALALDFVNTVDPRVGPEARDFLVSPAALREWASQTGAMTGARAPSAAELEQAVELREALYRVLHAVAHGRSAAARDLDAIAAAHRRTLAAARLKPDGEGYRWQVSRTAGVQAILYPILDSALELLRSSELGRLKECAGEGCGWLFIDSSRNGSRRWCSMEGCGTRAKMRAYRTRKRA